MSTPSQITFAEPPQWIGPEVSSARAVNSDSTRFVLVAVDHFRLYDRQGIFLRDLPIAASWEPRWDRTAAGSLYFVRGHSLMLHNPDEDRTATVHVFTEYVDFDSEGRNGVSGAGESDLSADGDHLALRGKRPDGIVDVFVYSLSRNTKTWLVSEVLPFDGLKISASNQWILSRTSDPRDPVNDGIFTPTGRILEFNGHSCPVRYESRDKLLWDSNAESSPAHPWQHSIMMVDIENPADRKILRNFGKENYATHISACDKGFCVVSAFDPSGILPTKLLKLQLSGTVDEICRWDNPGPIEENAQPKATVSADGTLVLFRRPNGTTVNTWMLELESPAVPTPILKPGETWIPLGALPYDETSDIVCFNSKAKNVSVYRRG